MIFCMKLGVECNKFNNQNFYKLINLNLFIQIKILYNMRIPHSKF
jgi:hypothetical protein